MSICICPTEQCNSSRIIYRSSAHRQSEEVVSQDKMERSWLPKDCALSWQTLFRIDHQGPRALEQTQGS